MTEKFMNRRWSTRNRIRAIPLAAAAIAAPTILRHSTLAQQVEIRLTGWTSSDAEQKLFEQILDEFRAANPDIKLTYEPIPSDYATKLQTDIAAGSVADVFYVDSLAAPDFMVNGALLELDSFMQKDSVNAADFYPGLIQSFQMDGKTYGLPKDWSSLAMVYDKKALTDAGVANPPTNWDELKAAGQALKAKAGEPRIVIPPDIAREFAFHYAAGAEVISKDGSSIVIDSPEPPRRSTSTTACTRTASPPRRPTPAPGGRAMHWPRTSAILSLKATGSSHSSRRTRRTSTSASPRCRMDQVARQRLPSRSHSLPTPRPSNPTPPGRSSTT